LRGAVAALCLQSNAGLALRYHPVAARAVADDAGIGVAYTLHAESGLALGADAGTRVAAAPHSNAAGTRSHHAGTLRAVALDGSPGCGIALNANACGTVASDARRALVTDPLHTNAGFAHATRSGAAVVVAPESDTSVAKPSSTKRVRLSPQLPPLCLA
jgi:hypothetical protein